VKTGHMLDSFTRDRTPRKVQIDTLERIHQALVVEDKRVFVFDGPTGCGKSEIGMAVGRHYGDAFITSPLNFLVDQYEKDFPELSAIKGKSNYLCSAYRFPDHVPEAERTCETATDLNEERHRDICRDYIPIRNTFWREPLSVTTLAFKFYARMPEQLNGGVDPRSILIIDECHGLEGALLNFGEVEITDGRVRKVGMQESSLTRIGSDHDAAQRYLEELVQRLSTALGQERFEGKEKRGFENLASSLSLTLETGDWIHWQSESEYTGKPTLIVKPLKAAVPAKRLFACADKLLFMSATVGKFSQFLSNLNIKESEASWYEADSDFPPENRRVRYIPVGNMGWKTKEASLPLMIERCRAAIDRRPNAKGVILVNSYPLSKKLAPHLGPRILTHSKDDKDAVLARHCASVEPTVLLGVAMFEGLDLKDDLARFLILPKVPYLPMDNPYIKERMRRDPEWYAQQAVLLMVQGAGRVVRSNVDWAEIFIIDTGFDKLLREHEDMFPRWFLAALEVDGKKWPQSVPATPTIREIGGS
jgi:Rad3-related DNA helicase